MDFNQSFQRSENLGKTDLEMEHSNESSQGAATIHAGLILTQSQGSYYRKLAKSNQQVLPLNITFCCLSGTSPMLPSHFQVIIHHCATLKQAGKLGQLYSRVHWSDYRLGIRIQGRIAKSLESTSQNRNVSLKMFPISRLRYCALLLAIPILRFKLHSHEVKLPCCWPRKPVKVLSPSSVHACRYCSGPHVHPWLILVKVRQKSLQYCKVISLQLK